MQFQANSQMGNYSFIVILIKNAKGEDYCAIK